MPSTTSIDARPDVHEMVVIHRVFRRELTALPGLIRGVRDTARARVVTDHLRLILAGLHMHHTGEDVVLWPLLLQRTAPSTSLVETMQAQHERVDAHLDQVLPLAGEWAGAASVVRGEQLAQLVEGLAASLFEHLDLEEREILPLVSAHLSVAEWDILGDHGKEAMTTKQLPLLFGAILEEADAEETARMLAHLPAPVRLLMRAVGLRQYRRYITRVRAG